MHTFTNNPVHAEQILAKYTSHSVILLHAILIYTMKQPPQEVFNFNRRVSGSLTVLERRRWCLYPKYARHTYCTRNACDCHYIHE